jgi:hypothetical protein
MSLATCASCEAFIDTDSDPDCCVDIHFVCESCREDGAFAITQEELDRNNGIIK